MSRVAVAAARFNEEITDALLRSCLAELRAKGIAPTVVRVPGAFELPWAAQELALSRRYDAVIALGCVMKGQTPQNSHLAASAIHHLHDVALVTRVPVILGVITPETDAQARERARGELDRGREAALAALEMLELRATLKRKR